GKYFVVQDANDADDVLQTFKATSAPNFHQAGSSYPVFASGQPTVNGLNKVLSQLICDGYSVGSFCKSHNLFIDPFKHLLPCENKKGDSFEYTQ
ncbi:hypothetical protein RRG08_006199, partial [Elysia crispata]